MRIIRGSKQSLGTTKPAPAFGRRPLSIGQSEIGHFGDQHHINSAPLCEAVKQLAPSNLHDQPTMDKSHTQLERNLELDQMKSWDSCSMTGDLARKVSHVLIIGCFSFSILKVFSMQYGNCRIHHKWMPYQPTTSSASVQTLSSPRGTSFGYTSILDPIGKLLAVFRQNLKLRTSDITMHDSWPTEDIPSVAAASTNSGNLLHKREMPLEEAESLVKQWQEIKADALGTNHQIQTLSEILDESMLSKWQDIANSAKSRSCFWRFVLVQLSILQGDIGWDADGNELAEIEALLEEAAELVDDSQPRNPSYYSKYKVQYILRRHDDGSWRFCRGCIKNPA